MGSRGVERGRSVASLRRVSSPPPSPPPPILPPLVGQPGVQHLRNWKRASALLVFNVSKAPYPRPRDPKLKFNVEAVPLRGLIAFSTFSKLRTFSREGQVAPAVVGGTNSQRVREGREGVGCRKLSVPQPARFWPLDNLKGSGTGEARHGVSCRLPGPGFNFEHFATGCAPTNFKVLKVGVPARPALATLKTLKLVETLPSSTCSKLVCRPRPPLATLKTLKFM